MKKRVLMVLLLVVLAAGVAFAQSEFKLSAGGGGFIGGDFGGGYDSSLSYSAGGVTYSQKDKSESPYFGGGGYAFFDATYAEVSIGYFVGKVTPEFTHSMKRNGVDVSGPNINPPTYTLSSLNFGLLGKYPFTINDKISFFPLLGIEYQAVVSAKDKNGNEYKNSKGDKIAGDFSALWFKAGAGMDFSLTNSIYLRLNALYGIRLPNKVEQDAVDSFKKANTNSGIIQYTENDIKTLLGHGLTVKLAVGFRF